MASLLRRLARYTRRDLREILAPTSLPDPPPAAGEAEEAGGRGGVPAPASTFARAWAGSAAYFDTWRRPPRDEDAEAASEAASLSFELTDDHRRAAASALTSARTAADAARPALRALYETRVTAYRDAVGSFAEGYREGLEKGAVVSAPAAAALPAAPAPAPKRKRGRPRKHPLPTESG